jgi:hypothetical protein
LEKSLLSRPITQPGGTSMKSFPSQQSNNVVAKWMSAILISLIILATGVYIGSLKKTANKTTIELSSYEVQPDDLTPLFNASPLVVEGVVKKVLPAKWTTPDGLEPSDIAMAMQSTDIQNDVQLRTPILIFITRVIKGNATGDLLFTIEGGESDNYIVTTEDDRSLVVGDRILIFLNKAPANAGPWAKISPYFPEYFFIIQGDYLVGTQNTVQKSEIENQIQKFQETK